MTSSFQLIGIDQRPFESLFNLSDEELEKLHARRCFASESPGYPCRISLEDARVGEELLLLTYQHQPAASPYRSSGPIFIRRGVQQRRLPVGEMPSYVTHRVMSVRAYDAEHMMVGASVCEGIAASSEVHGYFSQGDVSYIHLHNAKRGCFSCAVVRA